MKMNLNKEFDQQIAISLGETCSSIAREIRRRVDTLLTDADNTEWLLDQFGMTGLSAENFRYVLGEIFSLGAQYGHRDQLCLPLEDTLITGGDALMVLANYAREIFTPNYADGDAVRTYSNEALSNVTEPNGARSWLWQTCNELAYWQVGSGRLSLRSNQVTQSFFHDQCNTVFGNMSIPDTDAWNNKWIPLLQKTTHIYYTTGSQDPWTPTCMTGDDQLGENCVAHTITGKEIGHCSDLSADKPTDTEDLVRTRENILTMIDQWLYGKSI